MDGEDYCVKDAKEFILGDVSCDSKATSLLKCSGTENPICSVELTAMI